MGKTRGALVGLGCWIAAAAAFAGTDFRPPPSPALAPAWVHMDAGRHEEAIALVRRLADAGDVSALHLLGVFHEEGYVESASPRRAAELFHRAASKGSGDAFFDLAGLLLTASVHGWMREDPEFWERMESLGRREELRWKAFAKGTPRAFLMECKVAGDARARPGRRTDALAWCRIAPDLGSLSPSERRQLERLRTEAEPGFPTDLAGEARRNEQRYRSRLVEEGALEPGQGALASPKGAIIPPFPSAELIPLRIGNRWEYVVRDAESASDRTRVERISERRRSNGHELYRLVVDSPPDEPAMWRSNGKLGTYSAWDDPTLRNAEGEPVPTLWLRYPVSHPHEYESDGGSTRVRMAPRSIEVPAGRFRCLVYEVVLGEHVVERIWAAPGIGIVRYELWQTSESGYPSDDPARVEELVRYDVGPLPASR